MPQRSKAHNFCVTSMLKNAGFGEGDTTGERIKRLLCAKSSRLAP
jgi:hypothetical protein